MTRMADAGEVIFWSAEIILSIILAWGATRFWKHRPQLVGSGGALPWLSRWRAHLLYFGGWVSYTVYMFIVRPVPIGLDAWRVISAALIVAGLVMHRENRITD